MQGVSSRVLCSLCSAVVVLLCLSELSSQEADTKKRDYYEVLGIPQSASDKQVKKAFHQLAMVFHPDKNKSADAEKTFRELAGAYEVLSNRKKRERYDRLGHEAYLNEDEEDPEAGDGSDVLHFSFEELFQNMFLAEDEEHNISLEWSADEHHGVHMTGQSYWGNMGHEEEEEEEEEDDDDDEEEWVEEDDDEEKYQYW